MSSLMICDVSVPVLVHCDHALSVVDAGLLQHGVLFLTVIRSFVRIHLETMQIFRCSLSVFNSLTYFYTVGVHGSVLLRVLYLMLILFQIVVLNLISVRTPSSWFLCPRPCFMSLPML